MTRASPKARVRKATRGRKTGRLKYLRRYSAVRSNARRGAQVARASKSLAQVILSAEEMLESLKIFHAQMRDLLPSAVRKRSFWKQPETVAQALNPLKE